MRILVIQGHPEPDPPHFSHALAAAYERGARAAGHEVRTLDAGADRAEPVRDPGRWFTAPPPAYVEPAQTAMRWAEHWVWVYPTWQAGPPAALSAWIEQVFRHGFNVEVAALNWTPLLKGRSARIITTMAMPVWFYTAWHWQAGTLHLRRSVLRYSGIGPVRQTLIGGMARMDAARAGRWLARVERLGRAGR